MSEASANSETGGRLRLGAVIAVVIAVVVVVWLVAKGGDEDSGPKKGPEIVSASDLQGIQKDVGHPIYWVGPRPGLQYEITRPANGRIQLRYLPKGASAGDAPARYLSVGTYPFKHAYSVLQKLARQPGSISSRVNGGLAVTPQNRRRSVYLAYPGKDFEIELYSPSPDRSRNLAFSGQVRPVP